MNHAYLNGHIPVSPHLAAALGLALTGGETTRFKVAYALAGELELNRERLGQEAYEVLLELLPPLETFWQDTSKDPAGTAIRTAHQIVSDVAESLEIDTVLLIFEQMGLWYFQPPLVVRSVHELRRDMRLRLRETLDPQVFRMIDMWRQRDWDAEPVTDQPSRVIRSTGARPMSE